MNKKTILFYILIILCPVITFFNFVILKTDYISSAIEWVIIFCVVLLSLLSLFFKHKNYTKTYKIFLIINVFSTIFIMLYSYLYVKNLLYAFSSISAFRMLILSTKKLGVLVYIAIQAIQVIVLPVPATVIALAGAIIYGPFLGSLYCSIGVLTGSYIAFFLGRVFGFRLVEWVVGKANAIKYANILDKKGKMFLALAFLLPLFPDDILCLISGLTAMRFKYFFIITTIFRPIGVICMCYFGGGYIIPFHGWGIYVWAVLICVLLAFVVVTYKYQDKLQNWVLSKLPNKNKTKKNKATT